MEDKSPMVASQPHDVHTYLGICDGNGSDVGLELA